MRIKKRYLIILPVFLIIGVSLVWGGSQLAEALKSTRRLSDIHELNTLMNLHQWYHAAFMNDVDLEKDWSKRDDIVFAQNFGYYIGQESIKSYYGTTVTRDSTRGQYQWHGLTSSVIEVAGDRKTAKGVWYSPAGIVGGFGGVPIEFYYIFEKFGVDFVMEDGKWKIWHMNIYTDAYYPVGDKIHPFRGFGTPKQDPDKTREDYTALTSDSEAVLVPRPPEPYQTWADTWSYVDPGE